MTGTSCNGALEGTEISIGSGFPSALVIANYAMPTAVRYDPLGNLTSVTQGAEQRTFSYDAMSRQLSATNPESGTVSYSYDLVGNLLTRTDARGTKTTNVYDALYRLTSTTYSDGTPSVTYGYDAGTNGIGQVTSVTAATSSSTISTTNYGPFDAQGNVLASSQMTGGQKYSFLYGYNLAGALTSETYPSGRVVTTGFDAANRVASVSGALSGVTTAYVSNMSYWPHGAPYYFTYGNGLWRVAAYNARLQPLETYDALNNQNDAAHMLLATCPNWNGSNASGGAVYSLCPSWNGTTNNGNLAGLNIVQGTSSFAQTYSYDGVNRLLTASDSGGWSQQYKYDQYGNMWLPSSSGVTAYGPMPTANVYNGKNQNPNISYDAAGNQTGLGGLALSYDAENRQTQATNVVGGGTASYQYDGLGERVLKTVGSQQAVYVFDAFGKLAAEYDSTQPAVALCGTCYLSYDHLGSVRMVTVSGLPVGHCCAVTDQNGNVVGRHDYAPFGVEIAGGTDGRTGSAWGATTDVTPRFTGQLRDTETGEDYFNARYLYAGLGRFLSADPGNAGADLTNPQSWNGYAYVLNNPLSNVDPTGMFAEPGCEGDASEDDPCGFIPVGGLGIDVPWFPSPSGGSAPPPPATPPAAPPSGPPAAPNQGRLPAGSFPGGENLGLPPAMTLPGPFSSQVLFGGSDWSCNPICDFDPNQIEGHHVFSQQFQAWFEQQGVAINSWLIPLTARAHRMVGGIHSRVGGNWNRVWSEWIAEHPNASVQEIWAQARKMVVDFGIAVGNGADELVLPIFYIDPCAADPNARWDGCRAWAFGRVPGA